MGRKGEGKPLPVVDTRGSRNERSCHQRRPRAEVVVAEGWHAVHNAGRQTGKFRVKDAVAGPNTAPAVASEERLQEPMIELWCIGQPDSWSEVLVARGRERLWNSGIAGDQQPGECSWVEHGLRSGNPGLYLVVLLPERHDDVPAQARVDGEVAARAPTVLSVDAFIAVAQIERRTRRLRKVAGNSKQKIGVRVPGLCSIDVEGPIEGPVGIVIHLVDMKLSAHLQSVRADDFREPIAQIVGVVDLRHIGDRNPHDEGGKCNILHAFKLRSLHIDAGPSVGAGGKTLRGQAHAKAALRLPDDIGIAQVAEMKFVDSI